MTRSAFARAFALLLPFAMACGHAAAQPTEPRTVESVDLGRYTGRWFEVARIPNTFQSQCVRDVTATYDVQSDGTIAVVNRCRVGSGDVDEAVGVVRIADPEPRAQLEVRFARAFLSFLPFVWGDYWVLGLDPDYRWAVVGTPDREYLWILARSPDLPDADYQAALSIAASQGFDITRTARTPHDAVLPKPAGATQP